MHSEELPELHILVTRCLPTHSAHVLLVTGSTTFSVLFAPSASDTALASSGSRREEQAPSGDVPLIFSQPTAAMSSLLSLVLLPLRYPALFAHLQLQPPKGLLLYGQPGVGKTYAVRTICAHLSLRLLTLDGTDVWSGAAGDGEERLRAVFAKATESAREGRTLLFIDELDVLCPQRSSSASSPSTSLSTDRLTAQLLSLLDGLVSRGQLLVIAATNHPHSIDAALRRPGRFDREVEIPPPQTAEREQILRWYMRSMQVEGVDVRALAGRCIGYVGADLEAVCREAGLRALKRSLEGGRLAAGGSESRVVTAEDFEWALTRVPASSQRGSLSYLPSSASPYSFDTLGGLSAVVERLQQSVAWPFLYPATFARLNLRPPRGILLHGPPGCGKVDRTAPALDVCSLLTT